MTRVTFDLDIGGGWRVTAAQQRFDSFIAGVWFKHENGDEAMSGMDVGKGVLFNTPVPLSDEARITILDTLAIQVSIDTAVSILQRYAPEKLKTE